MAGKTERRLSLGRHAFAATTAATLAQFLPDHVVERVTSAAEQQNRQATREVKAPQLTIVPGVPVVCRRQRERRNECNEKGSHAAKKARGHEQSTEELTSDRDDQRVFGTDTKLVGHAADLRTEVVKFVPAMKQGHVHADHGAQDEEDDVRRKLSADCHGRSVARTCGDPKISAVFSSSALRASISAATPIVSSKQRKPMKRIFITAVISLVAGMVLGVLAARRMPPSREQVANYLSNLSVGELSDFTKRLTAQWGFQAFPPRFPGTPGAPESAK